MSEIRNIVVVTGTRAEYGYLKPVMKAIENDNQLNLIPIVTGMHLLEKHEESYKLVESDFPSLVKVPMHLDGDATKDMALYLSDGIKKGIFSKADPVIIHMMVVGFMMLFKSTQPLRERFFSLQPDIMEGHRNKTISEGMIEIEKLILKALKK